MQCNKTLIQYSSPEELSGELSKVVESGECDRLISPDA
jgi:hypothetical protein